MSELYDKAVRILAIREHSVFELRNKLKAFGSDEDLDALFHQLQADNYQSDERYAAAYVRSRSNRGYGPHRILMELEQRGVSRELARTAVDEAEVDWDELAKAAYEKKFGGIKPKDYKDQQKHRKFLFDRGFKQFDFIH